MKLLKLQTKQSKPSWGHDGFSVKLIRGIINSIFAPFSKIINKSFKSGVFLDALKKVRIVPVFQFDNIRH